MSATNTTPNIGLPSFIGTDKPAWLTDWNGAMSTIDTEIGTIKTGVSGDETRIGNLENSVSSLNTTVGNHTTSITALNTQVSNQGGTINTITSLIGNGTPTTTDHTIIGAINEINAKVTGKYVFIGTDEIAKITSDGVKTRGQLLQDVAAAAKAYVNNLVGKKVTIDFVRTGSYKNPCINKEFLGADTESVMIGYISVPGATTLSFGSAKDNSLGTVFEYNFSTNSYTNAGTGVPSEGVVFSLFVSFWDEM